MRTTRGHVARAPCLENATRVHACRRSLQQEHSRQVFGLGACPVGLRTWLPRTSSQCRLSPFFAPHRCGPVSEFHRIPFSERLANEWLHREWRGDVAATRGQFNAKSSGRFVEFPLLFVKIANYFVETVGVDVTGVGSPPSQGCDGDSERESHHTTIESLMGASVSDRFPLRVASRSIVARRTMEGSAHVGRRGVSRKLCRLSGPKTPAFSRFRTPLKPRNRMLRQVFGLDARPEGLRRGFPERIVPVPAVAVFRVSPLRVSTGFSPDSLFRRHNNALYRQP